MPCPPRARSPTLIGFWSLSAIPTNKCILCSQTHHESALPSQRYRYQRQLPANLNPIIPQDVDHLSAGAPLADNPPNLLELNAPRQRPPVLGNVLFGYSCMPVPAELKMDGPPRDAKHAKAQKILAELQDKLDKERTKRVALEAKLVSR